ncbi:hypothetical protein B0H14DRAFT_3870574 [Mycena olivaceomarginata]|nr:hypothetical protein B0H14DRAFT_3870574 [Mycena olivaceomarginata]
MSPQDPPFPSFSLVLSQAQQPMYSPRAPAHLVYPWTPVTYQPPVLAVAATPIPIFQPQTQTPEAPRNKIVLAIRRFFAAIVDNLEAHR